MRKTLFLGISILMAGCMHAQIFDNYGIRAGVGIANQFWDYSTIGSTSSYRGNMVGMVTCFNVEKKYNYFSLRPEIGYSQKGFKTSMTLAYADGTIAKFVNENVILHNLSINLSGKIAPLQSEIEPYLLLGVRSDLLLGTKDIELNGIGVNQGIIDNYNKLVLGGHFGMGVNYLDKFYFEIIYNPSFTKNYNSSILSIHDRFFEFTVGVNINKLFGGK